MDNYKFKHYLMWDFISLYYANMIRLVFMGYINQLPNFDVAKEKYLTEFEENEIYAQCYLCDAHRRKNEGCESCELAKAHAPCTRSGSPYSRLWELISLFNCSKDSATADAIIQAIETIRDCCK